MPLLDSRDPDSGSIVPLTRARMPNDDDLPTPPTDATEAPAWGSRHAANIDPDLVKLGEFEDLVRNPTLLAALRASGFRTPSPIQWKAIPLGRLGLDLIAQAKSGTGKTIVFSVLAIELASCVRPGLQALILAPTREIAFQIHGIIDQLTRLMGQSMCEYFIGGTPYQDDVRKAAACRIAVGTPGRVCQLLVNGAFATANFRMLILDEADKLMEESFQAAVKDIATFLPRPGRQTLTFSATYDAGLMAQVEALTMNPHYVLLAQTSAPTLGRIRQFYLHFDLEPSTPAQQVALHQRKRHAVRDLFRRLPFYQCIVFINHAHKGQQLADYLTQLGFPAVWIAGQLPQSERLDVLRRVRDFEVRVLVGSDLMARGIDIDRVDLVVNYDLPIAPATYFHRVGRTGRFGAHGTAVSLVSPSELVRLETIRQEFAVTVQSLPDAGNLDTLAAPPTTVRLREDEQRAYAALLAAPVAERPASPVLEPKVAPGGQPDAAFTKPLKRGQRKKAQAAQCEPQVQSPAPTYAWVDVPSDENQLPPTATTAIQAPTLGYIASSAGPVPCCPLMPFPFAAEAQAFRSHHPPFPFDGYPPVYPFPFL
ncbi:hypothetical protein IWQ60_010698 [Tieghemiomyces parasiticus]|uniref:RNA helicase n=1 Tax=Tieghemiomyces parasiticus TaxID=78921 RepID=A0A9W8DML1_9FUNG|nr:hypothetical protein IWQ60_010698 [Tieghemiomyces parasiticus]